MEGRKEIKERESGVEREKQKLLEGRKEIKERESGVERERNKNCWKEERK